MTERPDTFEDEIELMDYLRVIWKWKYLILGGTLVLALIAAIISFNMPKIYSVTMLLQPGILSIEKGGKIVYIDTPSNIKALIESGTFDSKILNDNDLHHGNDRPKTLKLKVSIPKSSNTIKIAYETSDVDQGLQILTKLGKLLSGKYDQLIKYYQEDYDIKIKSKVSEVSKFDNKISEVKNDISTLKAETEAKTKQLVNKISNIKAEREARTSQIKNLHQKISDIQMEIGRISKNTDLLIEERNKLLSSTKNNNNVLSSIIYSNTIQQNISYLNSLKGTTKDANYEIYQEKVGIQKADNEIKDLEAKEEKIEKQSKYEIEKLRSQIRTLESEKNYALEEIKNREYKKNSIQNIQIVQSPQSSPYPIKPQKKRKVMLAAIIGLFLTLFLAFFVEYISKYKKSEPT